VAETATAPETTTTTTPTSTETPPSTTTTTPTPPPSTSTTTGPPKYSYDEDRGRWIPPHRLTEVSTRARAAEERAAEAERRLQIALGGTPKSPDDAEAEKVANAFYSLPQFAHLKGLTPDRLAALGELLDQRATLSEAANYQWDSLAVSTLNTVSEQVADLFNADLTPRQRFNIEETFKAHIKAQTEDDLANGRYRETANGPRTKTQDRYERRDPALVADFVKNFAEDFIEPAKRLSSLAVAQQQQPRVPRETRSQPVVTQKPKINFADKQATEDAAVQWMREHGRLEKPDD